MRSYADAYDPEHVHHCSKAWLESGHATGAVDEDADGAGVAGEAGSGSDDEGGRACDLHLVEGLGAEGHGKVEFDAGFACDDAFGGHAHAADLAWPHMKIPAADRLAGDNRDVGFANGVEFPAHACGEHGARFSQADMADGR